MSEKNYGSVVIGMVTERDVMKKLVHEGMDAKKTELSKIITADPRVAQ